MILSTEGIESKLARDINIKLHSLRSQEKSLESRTGTNFPIWQLGDIMYKAIHACSLCNLGPDFDLGHIYKFASWGVSANLSESSPSTR